MTKADILAKISERLGMEKNEVPLISLEVHAKVCVPVAAVNVLLFSKSPL